MGLRKKINDELLITPPRFIPDELLFSYTMGGRIPVINRYYNNVAGQKPLIYLKKVIDKYIELISEEDVSSGAYPYADSNLYEALNEYNIKNRTVAIMGSIYPWYEVICLVYGGFPITIDYNKIISNDDRLTLMTVNEYNKNPIQVDMAFSISTFEHDGLGRYGDPLDPEGDIKAMKKMKTIIKKDGIMFLNVPYGKDKLVWNAHRIYGDIRFPLLIKGWEILKRFGDNKDPVFVLKNI